MASLLVDKHNQVNMGCWYTSMLCVSKLKMAANVCTARSPGIMKTGEL